MTACLSLLLVLPSCRSGPSDQAGSGSQPRPGPQFGPPKTGNHRLIDQPAADFTAQTLDNGTIRLSSLKSKVVLLNFWGIWCKPCRYEVPELVRLHKELAPKGFEILAINFGDDRRDVARYVADNNIPYQVVFDETLMRLYRVRAFPTNIVIDRDGHVRFVSEGYGPIALEDLRGVIRELM